MTTANNTLSCQSCGKERDAKPAKGGGLKTPKGWRKTETGVRCAACQAAQFVGRSIRLRITGPAESEERDRQAMFEALHHASRQSNQFANWMLQRLLAADVLTTAVIAGLPKIEGGAHAGKPKLPPAPVVEWYADAVKLFPHVAPSSLTQQAQMVQRYYNKERFAAAVAMTRNVRSYRWDGLPVVIPAQAWKLLRIEDDKIVLRSQIGPGRSWTLNVFAEGENLQRMRQLADGQVIAGTAMFVRRRRTARPGESKPVRCWYLRVSAQVPRATKHRVSRKEVTLSLGHDREALLYGAPDEGEDVFEYPAPALRALIAAHKKLDRQRQIENSFRVAEWRGSKRKLKRWLQPRTAASERNNAKIDAELSLLVAALTRWCQSHKITEVNYDVTPRGWLEAFPYHALAQKIQTSLENAGIALHMHGESSTGNEIDITTATPVEEPAA